MRAIHCLIFLLLAAVGGASGQNVPNDYQLKLGLDPLLELKKTWLLGRPEIDAQFKDADFKENPFVHWSDDKGVALFSRQPFKNVSVELAVLDGAVPLSEARLILDRTDRKVSRFVLVTGEAKGESLTKLRAKAAALVGGVSKPGPRPALGWKRDAELKSEMWAGANGTVVLQSAGDRARIFFGRPGIAVDALTEGVDGGREDGEGKLEFFVRLDQLLPVPELWGITADAFDAKLSMQDTGLKENPFFKWNTTDRVSARFSTALFANTSTDVLLFSDTVRAEEVNIEFANGRASKLVVTLLSRGNSGRGLTAAQFNETYAAAGRGLSAMLGVRPTHTTPAGMMLVKADGWLWTTPHTLALLEFNADAPKGQIEFLRLTVTPAAARRQLMNTAGLGNMPTTRSSVSLLGSVKRDRVSGDVEIVGVPMRDQGQKGYCVAASCERLLRYLGQPCDMDELAQLVGADAEKGASPGVMHGSLAKIDQRYRLHLAVLLLAPGHQLGISNSKIAAELDHARKAALGNIITEPIDHGVPLLWCVELPPGEAGLPPQPDAPAALPGPRGLRSARVGHMRLIIGYNSKTGTVIYSDSWGAGHERKVMPLAEAQRMTTAVFSMAPIR